MFRILLVALAALGAVFVPQAAQAAPLTGCSTTDSAYVFVRPNGANGLGHVGWGYRVTCTGTFYFGSVENPSGSAVVLPGGDNGFWWAQGRQSQMLAEMRSRGYTNYRFARLYGPIPDPDSATQFAAGSAGRGYQVIGNNCADNAYGVLSRLGVRDLPSLFDYPQPNNWYRMLEFSPSDTTDWSLSWSL
ncbi:hypothetical protein ACFY3U_07080 [Micromonospora sp. NPDC000089]|uniref:hypothetical protein n=1 Tax=unclassified Micromonospora TaxID=2617518 RepID=UPI0036BB1870